MMLPNETDKPPVMHVSLICRQRPVGTKSFKNIVQPRQRQIWVAVQDLLAHDIKGFTFSADTLLQFRRKITRKRETVEADRMIVIGIISDPEPCTGSKCPDLMNVARQHGKMECIIQGDTDNLCVPM